MSVGSGTCLMDAGLMDAGLMDAGLMDAGLMHGRLMDSCNARRRHARSDVVARTTCLNGAAVQHGDLIGERQKARVLRRDNQRRTAIFQSLQRVDEAAEARPIQADFGLIEDNHAR